MFMPVDNMARFWFYHYRAKRAPAELGLALHAVQDASIPHHAAGCMGNWHEQYENKLHERFLEWKVKSNPRGSAYSNAVFLWKNRHDFNATDAFTVPTYSRRIDALVTQLAHRAYKAYKDVYGGFADGYTPNATSMDSLLDDALVATLVSITAATEPFLSVQESRLNWSLKPSEGMRSCALACSSISLREISSKMYCNLRTKPAEIPS